MKKIPIQHHSKTPFIERVRSWAIDPSEKRKLLEFLEDLALGLVNRGVRISEKRQANYLDTMRTPLEFFGKPMTRLTLADVKRFEGALSRGELRTRLGRPYAELTRVDMRRALRVYLKWRLGPEKTDRLAGWLDTRTQRKTPDYLSEDDVLRLLRGCREPWQRFAVAVLFDSGARAEEFHNIRMEDLRMPAKGDDFVKLALKEEYSKTTGRTIGLYWKESRDAVMDYLKERKNQDIGPQEPVYGRSYVGTRKFLNRLGLRVLGRSIHYHLFRHSSATYYATRLNRQELCYRYGWKFSSDMPDVYISRSGMVSKDLDEKFTQTELGTVQSQLSRMEEESRIKNETIRKLQDTLSAMQNNMSEINAVLALNPTVDELKAAIDRKRAGRSKGLSR